MPQALSPLVPDRVGMFATGHGDGATHPRSSCVITHRQQRGHPPCSKICRFKSYLNTLVFDNKVTDQIHCKN
jgi:hypothetical protein